MLQEVVKRSKPLPPNSKILIFGGGFTGQHIAKVARKLGATVICTRRSIDKNGADFVFDSKNKESTSDKIFENITHVISCIPPGNNGKDPVIERFRNVLQAIPLKWVGYLSTTGVYGDYKGEWVKENSITAPKQERSIRRLSCEKEWESLNLPLQILRLPGIYGPGRSSLEVLNGKKNKIVSKPGQVFSRIHIDDIAGAIMHLIYLFSNDIKPKIINLADNNPVNNVEVLSYAAKLLDIPLPPIQSFETASKSMSPMALSFWQENRKVDNQLLCKKLGYSLIHPDFKSGLEHCFSKLQIN